MGRGSEAPMLVIDSTPPVTYASARPWGFRRMIGSSAENTVSFFTCHSAIACKAPLPEQVDPACHRLSMCVRYTPCYSHRDSVTR